MAGQCAGIATRPGTRCDHGRFDDPQESDFLFSRKVDGNVAADTLNLDEVEKAAVIRLFNTQWQHFQSADELGLTRASLYRKDGKIWNLIGARR